MSTIGALALTFADWAKRNDDQGVAAEIIELLAQTNDILSDCLVVEANGVTGHVTTVRTGLPAATWRLLNYGVPTSKSTTAKISDAIGMLETYSIVDKALADLNGNAPEFRLSEDMAFLEGMSQQMATTIFYGNSAVNPERFTGLSPRYNATSTTVAQSAANVIDMGGTQSTNTSLWGITWGSRTCHMIFPKGGKGGFTKKDKGDINLARDSNQNPYEAYTTHFKWDNGLTLRDWRYVFRLCNIDVSLLSGGSAANLITGLIRGVHRWPTQPRSVASEQTIGAPGGKQMGEMGRVAMYANRTIRTYLDIQAVNKTNVLLNITEWDGIPITTFRGVPIRTCDALLNTETRVT
jgi:hypothetical protein